MRRHRWIGIACILWAVNMGAGCAVAGGPADVAGGGHAEHSAAPAAGEGMMASCRAHMDAAKQGMEAARAALAEGRATNDPARLHALLDQADRQIADLQEGDRRHEAEMHHKMEAKRAGAGGSKGMDCGCGSAEHEH